MAVSFLKKISAHYGVVPTQQQIDYTDCCARSLDDDTPGSLINEMDGGGGKTIGFEIAGMLRSLKTSLPLIIATSTISNRDQCVDDLEKIIEFGRAIGHAIGDMPYVIYRSARDYASLSRVSALLERLRETDAPEWVVQQVEDIESALRDPDPAKSTILDDLLPMDIEAVINGKPRIVVTRQDIAQLPSEKPSEELAKDRQFLNECINQSAVIITTHVMLSHSRILRNAVRNGGVAAVVIDECDRLTNMDFITRSVVMLDDIKSLLATMETNYVLPVDDAKKTLQSLEDNLEAVRPSRGRHVMLTRKQVGYHQCDAIFTDLHTLSFRLSELAVQYEAGDVLRDAFEAEIADRAFSYRLDEIIGSIVSLNDAYLTDYPTDLFRVINDTDFELFARWSGGLVELHGLSATPGRIMAWLFASPCPIILTTAMLGTDRTTFAAQIGLSRKRIHPLSTTIRATDYGSMHFHYFLGLADAIQDQAISGDHIANVAQIIRRIHSPNDRTLVLTPGYKDIAEICVGLEGFNVDLFAQQRGANISGLRKRFIESPGIMLTVIWEGFNITTASLREDGRRGLIDNILITRMPFSQPNRMLRDLFVHHYGQRADGWLMMNNHAEVLRKIYQGVCRGIRGPNDHCRVYFADARMPPPSVLIDEYPLLYVKPNYKKMLEAIPARFIDDIDNFSVEDL